LDQSLVESLIQENEWIEQELFNPGSVEHSIWISNSPKRDLITRWASNLERLHEAEIYQDDINTISTYISGKLRKAGMQSAVHWVRGSLDYKYKNPAFMRGEDEDGDTESRQNSSILIEDEAKHSNALYIGFLKRTIMELEKDVKRLESDVILEPHIPQNEAEQFFITWDHFIKQHREAWDGREKVLSTQQYIMGYCLANYSLNHAYSKYLLYVKEKLTLTPKQAGKLMRLQVKKIQDIFNPKSMEESLDLGFYGQQCGSCGSYRTDRRYNPDAHRDELFCFAEHEKDQPQWSPLKTMKLQEVLL
jgi:hypothetical protein